jgi:hypothetical protein
VAGCIIEVEDQITEILYWFTPYEGIDYRPDQERNKDSDASAAEEFSG